LTFENGSIVGVVGLVGVVGAGVIGAGVAQALAECGCDVTLVDRDDAALERARAAIRRGARRARLAQRAAPSAADLLARVHFTRDLAALAAAAIVIENVPEDLAVKRAVHRALDAICADDCVFAANTSALAITTLAAGGRRPERVVGVHFMNPVPESAMVEVVRGERTSEATLTRVRALLTALGKAVVVVGDAPGFVINRVLMPAINEAIAVVHEGTASAADVDRLFHGCLGHPMGPLRTADLIGLDTVLRSLDVLAGDLGGARYAASPLLRAMVARGQLGRKTGRGFFLYDAGLQDG
jgi:3-hydroxybutyryl-CoA dehydrogenase